MIYFHYKILLLLIISIDVDNMDIYQKLIKFIVIIRIDYYIMYFYVSNDNINEIHMMISLFSHEIKSMHF